MQNTLGIFEDRKEEINFYYSIMIEIESAEGRIETIDNNRLIKIMKSNLLLMLYNLVEACVVSGMMEIYEDLKNDGCSYSSVISEIQNIWANMRLTKSTVLQLNALLMKVAYSELSRTLYQEVPLCYHVMRWG